MADTVRVQGYREFMRAANRGPRDTKREMRRTLKDVGELVRVRAEELFRPYSSVSAAGYRVSVRQTGVLVIQSKRKTTGLRPDYGALQMRKALLPARHDTYEETVAEFEHALDRISNDFNA